MLCHSVGHLQTQAILQQYYYPLKGTEPLTKHSVTPQEDWSPQQHCCEYIIPHILGMFMCFLAAIIFTVCVTLLCVRTQYVFLVHCNLERQQRWQVTMDQLLDWDQSGCQTHHDLLITNITSTPLSVKTVSKFLFLFNAKQQNKLR